MTGWRGTVEAYVVFKPGERMTMHVEWYNHFPLAKLIARDVDVRWGEHRSMAKTPGGGRAGRRADPRYQDRLRAPAQRAAGLLARTARRRSEYAAEVNVPG